MRYKRTSPVKQASNILFKDFFEPGPACAGPYIEEGDNFGPSMKDIF
jgi:hypothetical protein